MYTPGRHHGGSVDQGRDRRRTFHRVGQPDVQRNLRRLAAGSDQQKQGNGGQQAGPGGLCAQGRDPLEDLCEIQRSEVLDQKKQRDQKSEIADAVDDERLLTRRRRRILGEPEPDEQIRRQARPPPSR